MKKMDLGHFKHHKYDHSHATADTSTGREQVKNVQSGREMNMPSDQRPSAKVGSREKTIPPPKGM